jgi:hypothetical protein
MVNINDEVKRRATYGHFPQSIEENHEKSVRASSDHKSDGLWLQLSVWCMVWIKGCTDLQAILMYIKINTTAKNSMTAIQFIASDFTELSRLS